MKQQTILVVEGEEALCGIIKSDLEKTGFSVLTALDGADGLKKSREGKVDLIVLDTILPKIDGYAICRLLKFDEKYKNIPIIILSSKAQEKDRKMSLELGANDYIPKPYDSSVLLERINAILGLQ